MQFRDHHLNISVMLNGKPFKAIVDTGAPDTTLFAEEAKRVFDLSKDSPNAIAYRTADRNRPPSEYVFGSR